MRVIVDCTPVNSVSAHFDCICRYRVYFFWSLCLFFLSGCVSDHLLHVQIHRISGEDFASSHVKTPDPGFDPSLVGEKLLIAWNLPVESFCNTPTQLKIRLRFRTGQEQEQIVMMQKPKGVWHYPHLGASYREKGPIEAYFVQIMQNNRTLTEHKHALWVEKIVFTELE